MPNGFDQIAKEDFEQIKNTDVKLNIIFGYVKNTHDALQDQKVVCDGRFVKLEKRKNKDSAIAGGGGLFGGILAIIGKWYLFK